MASMADGTHGRLSLPRFNSKLDNKRLDVTKRLSLRVVLLTLIRLSMGWRVLHELGKSLLRAWINGCSQVAAAKEHGGHVQSLQMQSRGRAFRERSIHFPSEEVPEAMCHLSM